jgi:hypothetical protein
VQGSAGIGTPEGSRAALMAPGRLRRRVRAAAACAGCGGVCGLRRRRDGDRDDLGENRSLVKRGLVGKINYRRVVCSVKHGEAVRRWII